MNAQRNMGKFQDVVLMLQEDETLRKMRSGCCMFDQAKECNRCFSCIGLIHKKKTEDLNAFETAKLLEYKLYRSNLDSFSQKVNKTFRRNGGREEIRYSMKLDMEKIYESGLLKGQFPDDTRWGRKRQGNAETPAL
jgi:putative ATP-dependent endonuclease of the OLD family